MTIYDSDDLIVLDLPARLPWVDYAVCSQTDPEVFFPEKGASTADAKAVCRRCPVRTECLEAALARGERFGVYGGRSERERRRILRSRGRDLTAERKQELADRNTLIRQLTDDGVPADQIANRLGVSVNTVYYEARRAAS